MTLRRVQSVRASASESPCIFQSSNLHMDRKGKTHTQKSQVKATEWTHREHRGCLRLRKSSATFPSLLVIESTSDIARQPRAMSSLRNHGNTQRHAAAGQYLWHSKRRQNSSKLNREKEVNSGQGGVREVRRGEADSTVLSFC